MTQKTLSNATVRTYVQVYLRVEIVEVEVCVTSGMPNFQIVGLPEKAVKESRERVKAALLNSGYVFPVKKILVNLSPADIPKTGGYFDLPIALALLVASGQVIYPVEMQSVLWAGELSLMGKVVGMGSLTFAIAAFRKNYQIVMPDLGNSGVFLEKNTYATASLRDAVQYLQSAKLPVRTSDHVIEENVKTVDQTWEMIEDKAYEKVVLMIAAAGGHHVMLSGPPGTGKTMLSRAFSSLLPDLSVEEMLDVAMIYSWLGERRLSKKPPFRMPHHHITPCALLGGGVPFSPGEMSLAHGGVLFLDEITEYGQGLLDQLREALVHGEILFSRAQQKIVLPANFQLVVAMNPCPCGYAGDEMRCICGHREIIRHQKNISGPFLDRMDIHIHPQSVAKSSSEVIDKLVNTLKDGGGVNSLAAVRHKVKTIRVRQKERQGVLNKNLSWSLCQQEAVNGRSDCQAFVLTEARMGQKGRGWQNTIRLARTISDCLQEKVISAESLQLASVLAQHR